MAKLIRPTRTNIFGSAALSAELTEFGGSVPSTDINAILNNAAADRGWGTVGANGFPPMEWFNALGYGLSYYNAYLMQQGIPEWTALQNYYINSYAVGSDGKLYRSKTGVSGTPNAGNDPVGDAVNWDNFSDVAGSIHSATAEIPDDTDEFGFWDSVSGLLRKVTVATLKSIFAVLNSPSLTGTPTAPTAEAGTNTTQIATTAFVKAKSELDSIGVGQAWQDVTGSRVLGTVYTNSSGKPIQVHISGYTSAGTIGFQINSVTYQSYTYTTNGYICFSVIVPPGATYGLTNPGGVSIHQWSELR